MPPAIPALIAAAAATASAAAAAEVALSVAALAGIFATSFAISLGVGLLSAALAPSVKPSLANASSQQNLTFREAVASHRVIYGNTRTGGTIIFVSSTVKNSFLHLVVAICAHEIQSMDEIWLDDNVITPDMMDVNGNVTSGQYKNRVRIRRHLGTDYQPVDSVLTSEVPEWPNTARLAGIAYLYVRLQYDQDVFPSGIPNISVVMKGKKLYDPRTGNTVFSSNIPLMWLDYMLSSRYGPAAQLSDIDIDGLIAQANICDEFVAVQPVYSTTTSVNPATDIISLVDANLPFQLGDLVQVVTAGAYPGGLAASTNYYVIPYQFKDNGRIKLAATFADALAGNAIDITSAGSGTITVRQDSEPRFNGAGIVKTEAVIQSNLEDILTGCGGRAVYAGGQWRLLCASYNAPIYSFNENDFVGSMQMQTKQSRRDRFNTVKGTYISSVNDFQATDYPLQTSNVFVTEDGGLTLPSETDFPFTNRVATAQRIARLKLLRSRQEINFRVPMSLAIFKAQCGDVVNITSTRLGWVNKPFEIMDFALTSDGGDNPRLYVDVGFQETAAGAYNWTADLGSYIDPAPNTNLPNALLVDVPTGVRFDSKAVTTANGDHVFNLSLSWDLHPDAFVQQDGSMEVQFKRSDDPNWRPSFFVNGALTTTDILQSSPNIPYDLRIRAKNNLGVRSAWVTLFGAVVGSSGGVSATNNWGDWHSSAGATLDYGDWHSTPGTIDDWGYYS